MNKKNLSVIGFTFILSFAFALGLAWLNEALSDRIATNQAMEERRAVLGALGLDVTADVQTVFDESIRKSDRFDFSVYEYMDDTGQVTAYAVRFTDMGLWGTIAGYVGITASLDTLLGLEFTEQNETPGLGGRIEEDGFRSQFAGLRIPHDRQLAYGDELDAITGATSSSNAVINLLNRWLANEWKELEEVYGR